MITNFLRGNEKNIEKDSFIWNIIAGGVNASEAVVFMMVVTRVKGVEAAGILSIAFAVGNLLMCIGKYGVRNFQVTDSRRIYSFGTYLMLRAISSGIMAICTIAYIMAQYYIQGYSYEKTIVVLGICFIYVIESFEDVFLGHYQALGRLDIASKVFVCRWIMIMVVFIAGVMSGSGMGLAVVIALFFSLLVEIVIIHKANAILNIGKVRFDRQGLGGVVRQCFALFMTTFLTYYVTNAPKYAIDQYLTEDIQAYFGYISMPVFVVELLNNFLYQPQMVALADEWANQKLKAFQKRIRRQFGMIALLTIFCVTGAYLLGTQLLSVLYGTDVTPFVRELVVLMFAGGALAVLGYSSVILTIMRKQSILMYGMLVIAVLAFWGFGKVVEMYEMIGAATYYLFLISILAVFNCVCIKFYINKNKRRNEEMRE